MATDASTDDYQEALKYIQRDINCLLEENRNLKKTALINIEKKLFPKENYDIQVSKRLFEDNILKNLIRC